MRSQAACQSLDGLTPAEQQQVTEILDRYLQAIEQGETPDPERLVAEHPAWSGVLRRYLDSLGVIHQAARGMQGSEPPNLPRSIASNRRLGDYELRRQIGRGGMGLVYEARQVSLDRRVALKVLPLAAVLDKRQIARFRREAQAAAQLHHPHIVPVFGVGCEQGVHFYSMQLVEGQSLDRVLHSLQSDSGDETLAMSRPASVGLEEASTWQQHDSTIDETDVPPVSTFSISTSQSTLDRRYIDRVAALGVQAASALQHAHDYGVIHRDIKPSNLMLDRDGKLWVTDFGLAHIQSEVDMTATGDLVGTLRYMSPEQAGGGQVVDQRTDVYSLGITLYEMLTLQHAFPSADRHKLLRDIESTEPRRARKLNPSIPLDLETVLLKATAKDRDQRYSTAQAFADDLQRYLEGKPTLARRPTILDQGMKWAFRHQSLVACFLLMLTLALVGTSVALVLIQRQVRIAETQRQVATDQREVAEARFRLARRIVDQFTDMSRRLTKQPRIQREIQQVGLDYYERFIEDVAEDPTLVSDLASTHIRIGQVSEQLGDLEDAIASYRRAVVAFENLAAQDLHYQYDEVLSLNNLGQILTRAGRHREAETCYRRGMLTLDQLAQQPPTDRDQHRELSALVAGNLGQLLAELGEHAEARQQLDQAIALRKRRYRSHPHDTENRIRLAANYHNLCDLYVDQQLERAEDLCQQAIALQEAIVEERPDDVRPRADLALSLNNLGSILLRKQDYESAEFRYQRAIDLGTKLAAEAEDIPQLRHDLAISWNNMGQTRALVGDFAGAVAAYRAAEDQFRELLLHFPQDAWTKARLGGTLYNQAVAHAQLEPHDIQQATQLFEQAVQAQREAVSAAPSTDQYATLLKLSLAKFAQLLERTGDAGRLHEVKNELAMLQSQEGSHAN